MTRKNALTVRRRVSSLLVISLLVSFPCLVPSSTFAAPQTAHPPVEDLLGTWTNKEDGSLIVIEQLYYRDPQRKNMLRLKGKYDWGGNYNPATGELTFTRAPKFEEMNNEAPEWARKKVEGQLRWQFKFKIDDDGGCGDAILNGKWFPGEIKWREERDASTQRILKQEATVASESSVKPLEFEYTKANDETPEISGRPFLFLRPATSDRTFNEFYVAGNSLTSLTKGAPFYAVVRMPRYLADEKGNTLDVRFAAAKSGNNVTVRLTRQFHPSWPAVYTTTDPITIDDEGSGSAHIRLKALNEDKVSASYADSRVDFVVYNSAVQQGLAASEEAFQTMLAVYNTLLVTSRDRKAREAVNQKLLMIRNVRHFINVYQPKPLPALYIDLTNKRPKWEKITDLMRLAVARKYLELLEAKTDASPRISNAVRDNYFKEIGIVLTCEAEFNAFTEGLDAGYDRFYNRFFGNYLPQWAMGLYHVVAFTHSVNPVTQRFEQVLIIVNGTDFFGNAVDRTERILTAVNLASELVLSAANWATQLERFRPPTVSARTVAGGKDAIVDAVKIENLSARSYFVGAQRVGLSEFTPFQIRKDTCALMVMVGYLKELGLRYIPEDLIASYAAARTYLEDGQLLRVYNPRTNKVRGGSNVFGVAEMLKDWGVNAQVLPANLRSIEALLKRGFGISVSAKGHALRIRRVEREGGTKFIYFEDSWNGGLWKVSEKDFCPVFSKDYVTVVDLKGAKPTKGPIVPLR